MNKKRSLTISAFITLFIPVALICVFGLNSYFVRGVPPNPICSSLKDAEAIALCKDGQVARSIIDTFPLGQTTRIEIRQTLSPFFLYSKQTLSSQKDIDVYLFQERFLHDPDEIRFRFSEDGLLEDIWIRSETYIIW